MDDARSQALLDRLETLGEATESQARTLVRDIHAEGVGSTREAESLFTLSRRFRHADRQWRQSFLGAICDFLLGPLAETPGRISETGADWLIGQLGGPVREPNGSEASAVTRSVGARSIGACHLEDRPVDATGIDLLVGLCRRADGVPQRLFRFTLSSLAGSIAAQGQADAAAVQRLREVLLARPDGGEDWIGRFEAATLLRLNDTIGFAANDTAWNDLLARAVANHLLATAHPAPETALDLLQREPWLADTARPVRQALSAMAEALGKDSGFERMTGDRTRAETARASLLEVSGRQAAGSSETGGQWVLDRLGWDRDVSASVSPAERALVRLLDRHLPGFTAALVALA